MSTMIRRPVPAITEVRTAQFDAALNICIRMYRRGGVDCPLAAGIIAIRRRRRRVGGPSQARQSLIADASQIDGIYRDAATACCRAGGTPECPFNGIGR